MVLHELNNATQYLGMLHSVHSQDPASGILERSAADLGSTASSVEDLGLLMAILSTAAGTDLLMERRSGRGLSLALEMTIKAARKRGRDVILPERLEVLGEMNPAQGWELPWALGASLWIASEAVPEGGSLTLSIEETSWGAGFGGGEAMRAHAELVSSALPEVIADVSDEAWSFQIPEGWVSTSGAPLD
jgi:hypothetical protein